MKGDVANAAYAPRAAGRSRTPRSTNHNGGDLVIGPDDMLYISVGDGGGGGDTLAQRPEHQLAARQDPAHQPAPERRRSRTPSRRATRSSASPDRTGRDLDVRAAQPVALLVRPQDARHVDRRRRPGRLRGDRLRAARASRASTGAGTCARASTRTTAARRPPGARDPILERSHDDGDCAIIGGYVYRGAAIKALAGAYVYGDECTGEIRALVQSGGHVTQHADLHLNVSVLSTFGQGPQGALFPVSLGGSIYQIVRR